MKKTLTLAYGIAAYLVFLGVYVYLIAFLANWGVPKTIDDGVTILPWKAGLINFLLISLFAVQHSVMARRGFKRWWTKYVAWPLERSTYVLFSSLVFILIFIFWQPMPTMIWSAENPAVRAVLHGIMISGFVIAVFTSFLINHFELFGLQQVYNSFRNKMFVTPSFKTPFLYKLVRHPIQLGQMIGVVVTPDVTVGHLIFGFGMTLYIFVGLYFEEKDLVRNFGKDYVNYTESVSKIIPVPNLQRVPLFTASTKENLNTE